MMYFLNVWSNPLIVNRRRERGHADSQLKAIETTGVKGGDAIQGRWRKRLLQPGHRVNALTSATDFNLSHYTRDCIDIIMSRPVPSDPAAQFC